MLQEKKCHMQRPQRQCSVRWQHTAPHSWLNGVLSGAANGEVSYKRTAGQYRQVGPPPRSLEEIRRQGHEDMLLHKDQHHVWPMEPGACAGEAALLQGGTQ